MVIWGDEEEKGDIEWRQIQGPTLSCPEEDRLYEREREREREEKENREAFIGFYSLPPPKIIQWY